MIRFHRFYLSIILLIINMFFLIPACSLSPAPVITNTIYTTNYVFPDPGTNWTIMYYGNADCNLESDILSDVRQIKNGMNDFSGLNFIALIDRNPGYSIDSYTLGMDFSDTRLYRILSNYALPIDGATYFPDITTNSNSSYEANMGSADNLANFIRFCKAQYPANHYMLILAGHGDGARASKDPSLNIRAFAHDESEPNDDRIFLAEIKEHLAPSDSVDILGFDMCYMSSAEVAYELRSGTGEFSATYILATPPSQTGGWQYQQVLKRISSITYTNTSENDITLGGNEITYASSTLTPIQLGAIFVEERRDFCYNYLTEQVLTLIDTSYAEELKTLIDTFSTNILLSTNDITNFITNVRGVQTNVNSLHYFNSTIASNNWDWVSLPFFDVYNLFYNVSTNTIFSANTRAIAINIADVADNMVVYSYTWDQDGFVSNSSGVHIFFGDGGDTYTGDTITNIHWYWQWWYNASPVSDSVSSYGKLAWCKDGATPVNDVVDNWFEMLDSWYDTTNDSTGGLNEYRY